MNWRAYRACVPMIACMLVAACDGVGRALVGNQQDSVGDPSCMPLSCEPVTPGAPALDEDPVGGVSHCESAPADPPCDDAPAPEPLANGVHAQCRRALSLEIGELDLPALKSLSCERVVLDRKTAGTLRLDEVRWSMLDVSIRAAAPLQLEIAAGALDDVRITLDGPVSLRVIERSEVSRLNVASTQAVAGCDFVDSTVEVLRIGAADVTFAGSVDLQRTVLENAVIEAAELSAESTTFQAVVLGVGRLQLADSTGHWLKFGFDSGILSACSFDDLNVARCGRLAAYDSELIWSAIPACAEPTRLYGTILQGSSIEGTVVGDHANLVRVRVGASDVSELQLWDTELSGVALCEGTEQITLGVHNRASCVTCKADDGTWVPLTACRGKDVEPVFGTACGALFAPRVCDPEPQRMRPRS